MNLPHLQKCTVLHKLWHSLTYSLPLRPAAMLWSRAHFDLLCPLIVARCYLGSSVVARDEPGELGAHFAQSALSFLSSVSCPKCRVGDSCALP